MSATHVLSRRPIKFGRQPRHVLAELAVAGGAAVSAWLRNRRERRLLAGLDDGLLRDLGLSRADVEREYDRPFWQAVDYGRLDATRRRSGPRLGPGLSEAVTHRR